MIKFQDLSKKVLEDIVAQCITQSDVIRALGYSVNGWSRSALKDCAKGLGVGLPCRKPGVRVAARAAKPLTPVGSAAPASANYLPRIDSVLPPSKCSSIIFTPPEGCEPEEGEPSVDAAYSRFSAVLDELDLAISVYEAEIERLRAAQDTIRSLDGEYA